LQGLIPTGWIPSGVVLSPDNLQLAVINSKGLGAGPNLQGPNPYLDPESTDAQYVGSMIVGTLSLIDVPSQGQLRQDTQEVVANDRFFGAVGGEDDSALSNAAGAPKCSSGAELASGPLTARPNLTSLGRDTSLALQAGAPASLPSGGAGPMTFASSNSLLGQVRNSGTNANVPASVGHQSLVEGTKSPSPALAAHHQPANAIGALWAHPLFALFEGDGLL
jgi:hypothetical protein